MRKNDYAVFTANLAQELIKMGYNYVGKQADKNNPRYNVFYFENVEGLDKVVKELAAKRRK